MEHNPDRIALWPGYFDGKVSRRNGRRVPRDSAVLKPDLEGLFIAARAAGLKKVKREEKISHPKISVGGRKIQRNEDQAPNAFVSAEKA